MTPSSWRLALEVAGQVLTLVLCCQHDRAARGQNDGVGPGSELCEQVERAPS